MDSTHPVEIIVYVDDDDKPSATMAEQLGIRYIVGPRILLTQTWNELFKIAKGDIVMQCNDDVIFHTPGWNRLVEEAFSPCLDRILMVHGNDGGPAPDKAGAHPFVHRRWVEAVGYFVPPYFSSDFGDTWINFLANQLGRRRYLPTVVIEHMHHVFGKAQIDKTTQERLERHEGDWVEGTYQALTLRRKADVEKLKKAIRGEVKVPTKWTIMILTQPSRADFLEKLLAVLQPQVDRAPGVEIDIRLFDENMGLGENRQAMREQAVGEYSCFVDDDDIVAPDYVESILPLLDGIDYVGFQLQCYIDGDAMKPTYHSLKYDGWNSDQDGHYRDISHVNPILTSLALKVSMDGGFGEDHRWSDALRELNVVKLEHYVPEVMYHYYYRSNKMDDVTHRRIRAAADIPQPAPLAICPHCSAECTIIFSNGRRCQQCGKTWGGS
jgi:glycosyltransferase involved in cell wall biosynthesis